MSKVFAGIEAGGTKFVCALGTNPEDIVEKVSITTTTPEETLSQVIEYLKSQKEKYDIEAIGIGSFGPIDLNKNSETYGYITSTPKPSWTNTDIVGSIKKELNVPIGFDTDVNAAALGEHKWGSGHGFNNLIYLTVGTGIGGGAIVNGELLHGALHPEMGHILVPQHPEDNFDGCCPFHNTCLEGMASGTAIEKRWKVKATELEPSNEAWNLEAYYLACGITAFSCILSPHRIIIGGGVSQVPDIFPKIREQSRNLLNDYLQIQEITERIDEYIVPPMLGQNAGLLGSIALAKESTN